ncbi:MAG TPA: RraA family protein [Candidatus Dormibacteraeota bacterium]|nr:RraA family protein [Candidatus Dormibacteraeota bacterium]
MSAEGREVRAEVNLPRDASRVGVSKPKTAEMHSGPGFRIRADIVRPEAAVIAGLAEFDTPAISDLLNRLFTMDPGIKPQTSARRVVGPACTVKVFPGDNLMVHKSLDIAAAGDVIVVDTSGSSLTAALGDLISTKATHRGVAGFIVDGLVRDIEALETLAGFPVFARGITPIGPLHRGPGEVNYPIAAGGIVVNPGDIIVGDGNGVVVVPREHARDVLDLLRARAALEADYHAAVVRGDFSNAWVDAVLADAGVDA